MINGLLAQTPQILLLATLAAPLPAQTCGTPIDLETTPTLPVSLIHHGLAEFPSGLPSHPAPIQPRPFVEAGGLHYFSGTTRLHGEAPYTTTTQVGGAMLLEDLLPGGYGSPQFKEEQIAHFTPFNGGVAFIVSDGSLRQLYFHDPVNQMLSKIADIGADPYEFEDGTVVVANGNLLFEAEAQGSHQLWSSNGSGTAMVVDLGEAGFGGAVRQMTVSPNGQDAYFFQVGTGMPQGVYRTDGTAAGTVLLIPAPILPEHDPGETWIAFLGNDAIISVRLKNVGHELYLSNGTPIGTRLLRDFLPSQVGLSADLDDAIEWNGKLYFNGCVSTSKRKLYETDGTPAGTRPVAQGQLIPNEPWDMQLYSNALHFSALSPSGSRELYQYDGVSFTQVTGVGVGAYSGAGPELTQVGGQLFYVDAGSTSSQLVVSDGSGAGTFVVPGAPTGTQVHQIHSLTATMGGELLFSGPSPTGNAALWSVDPVGLAVTLLDELDGSGGNYGSNPLSPARVGMDVYVSAGPNSMERGIWRIDHNLVATEVVPFTQLNVIEGPELVELPGQAVFFVVGETAGLGQEPYVLSGAGLATTLLGDLSPGTASTRVLAKRVFEGALFFVAETDQGAGNKVTSLYRTDGTLAGTTLVHGAAPEPMLEILGDKLILMNDSPATGIEPWVTDGTPTGATPLADLTAGSASSKVCSPRSIGGYVFFVVQTTTSKGTLYATDGTPAGTQALSLPGGAHFDLGSDPNHEAVVWNGQLFAILDDGVNGDGLWKSGGTPATTQMVVDLQPGASNPEIRFLTAVSEGVFLVSNSNVFKDELFRTDGTAAGTQQLTALTAATGFSYVIDLQASVDGIYFEHLNGLGKMSMQLVESNTISTICSGIDLNTGTSKRWVEPFAGGLLTQGEASSPIGLEPTFIPMGKARSESLGTGSTLGSLTANAPQLGQVVTVQSTGAPGVAIAALLSAPAATWPVQVPALAEQLAWLDPMHMQLAAVQTGANWSVSMAVPTTPALVGKGVMVQAFYLGALGLPGELSNALALTVGL